ncbi:EAL domain-containing protein [Erwinia sp. V90_4]|uniref:EAL domain-containing protein n=1 Tax=Erwinia sp. V90_4 TaxID=3044239 RepID=UPI00249E1DBD|nr:EAL domain-containing protein [Erwinia sp. V90_4]MDI3438842.1 EAL domain-containing protein [Erwinia sp. V90_4]
MTESLLHQACRHFRERYPELKLALNIPASMAEDLTLPETVRQLLLEESFPPSRLEIEIAEDALIANMSSSRINLDKFTAMGVTVSLDDFGTGHSGL